MHHSRDGNRSAHDHCDDRHQQTTQTQNSIYQVLHCTLRNHSIEPQAFGGADRDRTGGLLVANQALSQLSYSPTASFKVSRFSFKVFETLKLCHLET